MKLQLNYIDGDLKRSTRNHIIFVDEKFNISGLNKLISNSEFFYISDLLKTNDLKKKILTFNVNSKKTIFLISINKKIKISDIENLGAEFYNLINNDKKEDYVINSDLINPELKNFIVYFLHGLK